MKENIHGIKSHNDFMTEKERVFVENCHRKSILNTLNHKDFSPFFEEQFSGALLIIRKEARSEHKTEYNEAQRNLFSSGFAKSRKKPRLVSLSSYVSLPVEMQTALRIEEFCILVLKIKYRYNVIFVQKKERHSGYDPGTATENHIVEYETVATSMFQENLVRFSRSPKFFGALYDLHTSVNNTPKKSIVLTLLNSSDKIDFTAFIGTFIDRIFRRIPKINKDEIHGFCAIFYKNNTGVVFATALLLSDPSLAREFMCYLNDEVVRSIFEIQSRKIVWQFFGVMASYLGGLDKRDLILLVREKLMKAINLGHDKSARIFLKSIGIEEDDLK